MRPKDIGTRGETAVVNYLRANGWPHAERRALHGNVDLGDVTGTPGLCWEVKAGDAAKAASDRQIIDWLEEAETERFNSHANFAVLVTARHRKSVGDWWAHMYAHDLADIHGAPGSDLAYMPDDIPVRLRLESMVDILRARGYGGD